MRTTFKILAATLSIGAGGIGVAAVTSAASGDPAQTPDVAAMEAGAPDALPASAQRVLTGPGLVDQHADLGDARAVPAPDGASGTWYLVPSDSGACLVTGAGVATCAPTSSVDAGTLSVLTLPGAPTSDGSGRPVLDGATIAGVAPDGTTSAKIVGPDGQTIDGASVESNVYRLSASDVPDGAKITLTDDSGDTSSVPLG